MAAQMWSQVQADLRLVALRNGVRRRAPTADSKPSQVGVEQLVQVGAHADRPSRARAWARRRDQIGLRPPSSTAPCG